MLSSNLYETDSWKFVVIYVRYDKVNWINLMEFSSHLLLRLCNYERTIAIYYNTRNKISFVVTLNMLSFFFIEFYYFKIKVVPSTFFR